MIRLKQILSFENPNVRGSLNYPPTNDLVFLRFFPSNLTTDVSITFSIQTHNDEPNQACGVALKEENQILFNVKEITLKNVLLWFNNTHVIDYLNLTNQYQDFYENVNRNTLPRSVVPYNQLIPNVAPTWYEQIRQNKTRKNNWKLGF